MSSSDDYLKSDTSKRFEIFLPSPKARINLGKGCPASNDIGPFGYTGVSIQSNDHIFIDGNKHTLYQTGQNYCGQVGGSWSQFSSGDMFLSSTNNINLSTDNKVVIASGAGQGQITAMDHGPKIRLVGYNSLGLHYTIDTIQTGLFEFFYGRHTRDKESSDYLEAVFNSTKNREIVPWLMKPSELRNKDDAPLTGGFLNMISRSERQFLQPGIEDSLLEEPNIKYFNKALFDSKIIPCWEDVDKKKADLEFAFSGYYARFDPYKYKNKGFFEKLHKLVSRLKRYSDVALKYGEAVQSTVIIAQAIQLMEGVGKLFSAAKGAYSMATDSFPGLLMLERAEGSGDRGFDPFKGGVADEAMSGAAARVMGVIESTQGPGKKASIESNEEPETEISGQTAAGWDLTSQTDWSITVHWDGGSEPFTVTTSEARGAEMTLSPPELSSASENKTLAVQVGSTVYTVALTPSNTDTGANFESAIDSAIPDEAATVSQNTSGDKVEIVGKKRISLDGSTEATSLSWTRPNITTDTDYTLTINGTSHPITLTTNDTADLNRFEDALTSNLGDFISVEQDVGNDLLQIQPTEASQVQLPNQDDNEVLTGRLGASLDRPGDPLVLTPPRLNDDGETDTLVIAIDGYSFSIGLNPSNSTAAEFANTIRTEVNMVATVSSDSSGDVTITSRTIGANSVISVSSADYMSRIDPSPSKREKGADAVGQRITVSELSSLLGSLSEVSVSTSGDKLKLEAKKEGNGSHVKVTGDLAAEVFGTDPTEETITDDSTDTPSGFSSVDATFKTLVSWNHELQKLPEDTRNLTRPLTEAISDTLSTISNVEKALKKAKEIVGQGSPPTEAIGMFANDGITMGTQDRIVGSGGQGIVFIADGGSGCPDRGKFVFSENWVTDWMSLNKNAWKKLMSKIPGLKSPPDNPLEKRSLGFRVLSDSAVDMIGTTFAQIKALGRANLKAARPDGKKDGVGIGIARIVGSYAAEVAGYEKVVISARSPGKKQGDEYKEDTGGRVELAGQTIAIGAVQETDDEFKLRIPDFYGKPRFGIERLQLDSKKMTGTEHLGDGQWAVLADEYQKSAWSPNLQFEHPRTQRVQIHGAEIVARALPFMFKMNADGIVLGLEPPNEHIKQLEQEVEALDEAITHWEDVKKTNEDMVADLESELSDYSGAPYENIHGIDDSEIREFQLKFHKEKIEEIDKELELLNEKKSEAESALDDLNRVESDQPFPRIEITSQDIRIGLTDAEGNWLLANDSSVSVPETTSVAPDKTFPFINIDDKNIQQIQNPGLSLSDGVATLSNGEGTLEIAEDTATMTFSKGITTDDGSIKLQVKNGTIKLG